MYDIFGKDLLYTPLTLQIEVCVFAKLPPLAQKSPHKFHFYVEV